MNKKKCYALLSGSTAIILSIGIWSYSTMDRPTSYASEQHQKKEIPHQSEATPKREITGIFPSYTLEELKEKATLIVEGTPTKILDSYEKQRAPFTKYKFHLSKVYKGDGEEGTEIQLLQDGNKDATYNVHPLMEVGEKYILFLERTSTGALIMVGGPAAKYEYNKEEKVFESIDGGRIDEHLERK